MRSVNGNSKIVRGKTEAELAWFAVGLGENWKWEMEMRKANAFGWTVREVSEVVPALFAMHHKSILWPQTPEPQQNSLGRVKWTKWSSGWLAFNLRPFVN